MEPATKCSRPLATGDDRIRSTSLPISLERILALTSAAMLRSRAKAHRAKAGRAARELWLGRPRFPAARPTRLPTKISKTTPCKVTGGRWHGCFTREKHFDTSGKSVAPLHHRAICKTAHGAAHRNCGDSALNPFGFGDSALVNGFSARTASASSNQTMIGLR
jgi:hypothetical protein